MSGNLVYGKGTTDRWTFLATAIVAVALSVAFAKVSLKPLWQESAESLVAPWAPIALVMLTRFIALACGIWAIISMFRVGPGNMQVLLHERRTMKILHPVNSEKFVTFSSWTLLCNILYFGSVSVASVMTLNGKEVPLWLERFEVSMFAIACSSAFLTATIVRHILLPDLMKSDRDPNFLFTYHEQIMHNFAAIFLAVELFLVGPTLHPEFGLYCVGMGLVYVGFAYIFAYQGGGYYVYSFIDPRLKNAPFVMLGLAAAIAVVYLMMTFASIVVQANPLIGALLLVAWVSKIVQFSPTRA
jgi:hypothetical protein|tara:strand:+ start:400 stop:1299 length:900 start_codon:yes stop_codon:yes gene_type:complete